MSAYHHPKDIPWRGIILAALGAAFCLYASSAHGLRLCLTAGCQLNRNFTLFGVSAWYWGAAAFCAFSIAALLHGRKAAAVLAALFLGADCVFLLLMALTLPCLPCLGAAIFFLLIFLSCRSAFARLSCKSLLPGLWTLLFLSNLLLLAREELSPAPLHGPKDAPVKLYFSPSCPACREALRVYALPIRKETVALYPVAEQTSDLNVIAAFSSEMAKGAPAAEALDYALDHPVSLPDFSVAAIRLSWQTRANQAVVLAHGGGKIPFILQSGIEATPTFRPPPSMQPEEENLFDLSLHGCGGNEECPLP